MKNKIRYIAIGLLLAQVLTLAYILRSVSESGRGGRLLFQFLGGMVLVWFIGLMVFTAITWYKSSEKTQKKDRFVLITIGVLTFFSAALTFGWIS